MNQEITSIRVEWDEEIRQLREKSRQITHQNDLVAFYGSSSLRLWDNMAIDLYPANVLNMAFGGSSYFLCDYFFDEVFEFINPTKIVLYAGDNDLGNAVPEVDILTSVNSLLRKIENRFPSAALAIIGVKPSPDREYLKDKMMGLNHSLSELMTNHTKGSFIDIYSEMLKPNGSLRPELYIEDQLHINEAGYEIWKRIIGSHVTGLTS
ncbi:MAG: GDSL-type esterase/lipase family protein [Bacteroidota bacterium]